MEKDFGQEVQQQLVCKNGRKQEVIDTVRNIISDVRSGGDAALLDYTKKFDGLGESIEDIVVSEAEIKAAYENCSDTVVEALKLAYARIADYQQKIKPEDIDYEDALGMRLGNVWRAVASVGLYVPGGQASYPSSVLMNAAPAIVAGVKNLIMVVPAPRGKLSSAVLVAADIAGIKRIFKIGGAQAVAALAYGTETIPKVDMIVGPGNAYVAEAKREVYGEVGIDMIAGPSEILVVADESANAAWVAADLLSQAEHDEDARSVLVTKSKKVADAVEKEMETMLMALGRKTIAYKSWQENGLIVVVDTTEDVVEVINLIAPEHLELCCDEAEFIKNKVEHAGAIFMGNYTPEAIGDYIAGPSHVLPTSGTARFSSGLSVFDFLKRVSLISCTKEAFDSVSDFTQQLAEEEGLDAHALSVKIRQGND